MNRLPLAVLVFLISLGGFVYPGDVLLDRFSLTATAEAQQDPAKVTVYITRTGEKYHKDGCRHLRQSRIATTLKNAAARGFGACSVCKPPTIR